MTDEMILTSLEQIVRTVKIALRTDAETARALRLIFPAKRLYFTLGMAFIM